jgi:hypothetical protein
MRRTASLCATVLVLVATVAGGSAVAAAPPGLKSRVFARVADPNVLSQGARAWLQGPGAAAALPHALTPPSFGSNVDANDPNKDLAAGQSETAIAAQFRTGAPALVMAAWNDATALAVTDSTDRRGSLTGVSVSGDGGRSFHDLIGLPNNNVDQQWAGDPVVASLRDGRDFVVGSLYYPSFRACTDGLPAQATIAVSIARVAANGSTASFTAPIPIEDTGDVCSEDTTFFALDKDWLSYNPQSRTLAVSYTKFSTAETSSGLGQIEVVRAKLPADPRQLRSGMFSAPRVIWREEPFCPDFTPSSEALRCGAVNQGAYVRVLPGGDTYVAWERNIVNAGVGSGDPYVYIHAAYLPAAATRPTVGGPSAPFVVSTGQPNGNAAGGVKSLNNVSIAGYSRGPGNDFPRLTYDGAANRLLVEWNDASLHPLGDIWLRALTPHLAGRGRTQRVNDDNSFALHFMPAVSVRSDGTICSSWYDRRLNGADSTRTDYFGECRTSPTTAARDFRITTGGTDWAGTSSLIDPNFGDYTDNTASGSTTYFTWSDGRLGVPQPFVARR